MSSDIPYVPKATAEKLSEPFPKGTRHDGAIKIAVSLIGNGVSPRAVFHQLRDKFPADMPDKELEDVVNWAVSKSPTPSGYGKHQKFSAASNRSVEEKKRTPVEHATWWLNGERVTMEACIDKSQIQTSSEPAVALREVFELLYNGPENLNIVCAFELRDDRAVPKGAGRIITRDKWIEYILDKGVPTSRVGAWFRPNPVKAAGSGHGGAVTDSDVESFRFLLLESDVLDIEMQLAFFARIKLPISAITLSGGSSAHAWVRLDAKDIKEYEAKARRILTALSPFGIDPANKNPSRLSRLPGAVRKHGAKGTGEQRLLQLNPGAPAVTDAQLDNFENLLLVPCVEEKPFQRLIEEAIPRYEWMIANQGKLGVPTGFSRFDKTTGGLKPGGYTLVAAATGVGKTTIALNMINAALNNATGVVLFSLEMSREDITDMMFSMNCNVDRNAFNTGEFTQGDIQSMAGACSRMKNLPLWVDDDPSMTMNGIRVRTLALRAELKIGLVVVDYAQLALPDGRPDSREQAVAETAQGLRKLSREANVPIIVLSQLNDEGKVRESRRLTHEAATVLFLQRDSGKLDDPNLTLYVSKGRKIPSSPIHLYLKAEHCRITERSPINEQD